MFDYSWVIYMGRQFGHLEYMGQIVKNYIFNTIGVNSYILPNKGISDIILYPYKLSINRYVDMSIF